jgi:hypothetical protein
MSVYCSRKGGMCLKIVTEDGFEQVKLKGGQNDVDPARVEAALECMAPEMADALRATLSFGDAALEKAATDVKASDKVEMVKAAASLGELEDLMAGENRKTVLNAIEKRMAELQGD